MCICDRDHLRVECFGYDHDLDRCSSCFANGQCLKGDRLKMNDFLCLCPRCHYGTLCQFNNNGLSSTLDSLILQVSHRYQIMYFVFVFLIFFIGVVTNYASFITFKRVNLRKSAVGIYLLLLTFSSQCSLFSLIMKMILILFNSFMNDISCKIISYMLSISIRYSSWLTSWIAIVRLSYVLFPFATALKSSRIALTISLITLLIIASMHVHELIFYLKDPSGQSACVANFPSIISTYDRITILTHYLFPFIIQILSITILIIFVARSRSRSNTTRDAFMKHLKRQFKGQKELYITPLVIILSGLPQTISSFSFACIQLAIWQRHALLTTYFLSYAPQLLGFVLFVLPSSSYMQEFRATNLSKIFLFKRIKQ